MQETEPDIENEVNRQLLEELYWFVTKNEAVNLHLIETFLILNDPVYGCKIAIEIKYWDDKNQINSSKPTIEITISDGNVIIVIFGGLEYKINKRFFKYNLSDPRCFSAILTMVCKILKGHFATLRDEVKLKLDGIMATLDSINEIERNKNGKRRKYKAKH